MKGVNSKDNKSDPYDNSTNNSVVTMNANAVTSETQTSNSSDNAASFKNTQIHSSLTTIRCRRILHQIALPILQAAAPASHRATLQVVWAALTWMPTNPVYSRSMVALLRSMQAEMESTSNDYFYMNGGTVYVEGPESNGDSALDYSISASITGGCFLATGYSGMAQSFGSDSTQCTYILTLSSNVSGTTTVTLTDNDENVLLSHETTKSYNSIIVSCPELTIGSTYTLTAGNTSQSITPTSTVN